MAEQCILVTPGSPRPAGWCPECALPSLVTVDLYAMTPDGLAPMGSWTGCSVEDCNIGVETDL